MHTKRSSPKLASGPTPDQKTTGKRNGRDPQPTVLPDIEAATAEQVERSYEKGHAPRKRSVGRNPSPARVQEHTYWRLRELSREAENDADVARGALPEERYDELRARAAADVAAEKLSEADLQVLAEWEPTSTVDQEPDRESEVPVLAAVLMLKHMSWMLLRLACRTGARGPHPRRRHVAATIVHMAFSRGRPEVWDTAKEFNGSQPLLGWSYGYPTDDIEKSPERETFYEAVHEVLSPKNLDPRLAEHLQVETFRQLATQVEVGKDGQTRTDRKGQPILKHPKAGLALIADGSFTEGQAPQTPYADEEHRQIRIRHRRDRDGIRLRVYGNDGSFSRSVVGYKLVTLVCATTARCVISTVVPADSHEPDVVIYLLERLFALWPECPAQYLVGDGLYGHGKDFIREVMFRFGMDPIFPWRADYPKDNERRIRGVPVCTCTGSPRPMKFKQRKGKWWGPAQRREGGLPRGEQAPGQDLGLRYEYVCPSGTCKSQTTRPWDDPRIHTFLPHTGEGHHASLRRVLLRQRNVVESHYAALQRLGMQGRGVERPQWASDVEVHWMLALGSTFLTARRLVFENGLYERAVSECEQLHLLDNTGRKRPAPGPTEQEVADAVARRIHELDAPAAPASWVRECGGRIEPLTGSAEAWAKEWGVGMNVEQKPSLPEQRG
jgi:hypothetical protein